jgi:hypothetical protein
MFVAITLGSCTFIQAHSQGINWAEICRSLFVDKLITESCSGLTTNDGYQLTAEGERIVACVPGKALMLAEPSGGAFVYAQKLKSLGACGSSGEEESPNGDYSRKNNQLDQTKDLVVPSEQGINWGAICRNPFVDKLISEPCDTLTTNGGYQLTPQGERAIACIAGGFLLLADPTGQAFNYGQKLKSMFGCGGGSPDSNQNPFQGFLNSPQDNSYSNSFNNLLDEFFNR